MWHATDRQQPDSQTSSKTTSFMTQMVPEPIFVDPLTKSAEILKFWKRFITYKTQCK